MTDAADRPDPTDDPQSTGGPVVAIDGPSGSGKSSVSREVAHRLGLAYLDTGAMYRALTWWCLEQDVDLADQQRVADESFRFPLDMGTDPLAPTVRVGGTLLDAEIRGERVSSRVSEVATNLGVRADMLRRQRAIIAAHRGSGGVVAEGRDITTVVAPDADVRILLTASSAARLARRAAELHGAADEAAVAATRDLVVARDERDSTVSRFFEPAEGVTGIDTSHLDFAGSVDAVLATIRRHAPA